MSDPARTCGVCGGDVPSGTPMCPTCGSAAAPAQTAAPAVDDRIACPRCGGAIKRAARKCWHCGQAPGMAVPPPVVAPPVPQLRPATTRFTKVNPAQEVALNNLCTRAMIGSIVGTVICSWVAGALLGPVMLFSARSYQKRFRRIGLPAPGAVAGIYICGAISSLFGLLMVAGLLIPVFVASMVPARVIVDNGLDLPVEVHLDGTRMEDVQSRMTARLRLKAGSHQLVIRDATGAVHLDRQVELRRGGKYVVNPGARLTYEIRERQYGGIVFGSGPSPVPGPTDAFWDASAYDFVLEDFPAAVEVPRGASVTHRNGVFRASP